MRSAPIGLARCIAVGAALGRPLYEPGRSVLPCAARRTTSGASVDHFYTKLLKLAGTMQTAAGRREAERRTEFLRAFLAQLESEIGAVSRGVSARDALAKLRDRQCAVRRERRAARVR